MWCCVCVGFVCGVCVVVCFDVLVCFVCGCSCDFVWCVLCVLFVCAVVYACGFGLHVLMRFVCGLLRDVVWCVVCVCLCLCV